MIQEEERLAKEHANGIDSKVVDKSKKRCI